MTAANDNTFSLSSWALAHSVLLAFLGCFALWLSLALFAPDVFMLIIGIIILIGLLVAGIMGIGRK